MSDDVHIDVHAALAALRAELVRQRAAQEQLRAALHRATARPPRRVRGAFAWRLVAGPGLALLLALVPLGLLAATPFHDLNPDSVHNANIEAIYTAGVTTGCVPNQEYCPNASVTREERASFLARLGGLGTSPPVANAAALGGKGADGLVRVARGSSSYDYIGTGPAFAVPAAAAYSTFAPMPGAAVTIAAPASGFVPVTAAVDWQHPFGERPYVRLRDTTPGVSAVSPVAWNADGSAGQLTLTWVFPVSGAGTRTFALEVAQYNPIPEDIYFFNDALTALFVPFGYDGGTTLAP